jgi:hypothetical protein
VIYLSGCVRDALPSHVGVMLTPMMGNRLPEGRRWAADTGCFNAPHKHDDDRYVEWLAARYHAADRCLFATAPDVLGDAMATIAVAKPMLGRIRDVGFKAALIAQDGMERLEIPWNTFDCLFIGGTTGWKLSEHAYDLMRAARRRNKWVHVGRVNSYRRLVRMRQAGAHSVDGTYLAFGPDTNTPKLQGWLDQLQRQPDLF